MAGWWMLHFSLLALCNNLTKQQLYLTFRRQKKIRRFADILNYYLFFLSFLSDPADKTRPSVSPRRFCRSANRPSSDKSSLREFSQSIFAIFLRRFTMPASF